MKILSLRQPFFHRRFFWTMKRQYSEIKQNINEIPPEIVFAKQHQTAFKSQAG
ncbi:MAG: hypothetical protein ACLFPR_14235 [Desulfococcaceae bacterium]